MADIFANYGKFGIIAEQYDQYRLPYDESVFREIFSNTHFKGEEGQKKFRLLDMGCGTGHFTFALSNALKKYLPEGSVYSIIGIDTDETMIKYAEKHNKDPEITFYCGRIYDMFNLGRNFDMIFCANSFHWIVQDNETLKNLYSLLRGSFTDGRPEKFPIVVISKNIVEPKEYRESLRECVAQSLNITAISLPDIKKEYNPSQILYRNNFTRLFSINSIEVTRDLTPEELAHHATSTSLWNCIPEEQRIFSYKKFLQSMNMIAIDGVIKAKDSYSITIGYRH